MEPTDLPSPARRRACVVAAGAAAAALFLSACSSGSATPEAATGPTVADASSPTTPTTSTATAATSATAPTAPGAATASATGGKPSAGAGTGTTPHSGPTAPPHAPWDYQIGGAYPPPAGVRVVSRDQSSVPVAGLYNICYINAFQAQPGSESWWAKNHPDLILKNSAGTPIVDQDWNEQLLDVSTADKRSRLAQIEDGWIDACAAKGFQAVEPDNYESYSRSQSLLTPADDIAFATLLARHAHGAGLAIAQKNGTELLGHHAAVGFDFAVAEQCGQYDECGDYATAYDGRVVDVEYDDAGFAKACAGFRNRIAIVRRDRDVTPAGSGGHVYQTC